MKIPFAALLLAATPALALELEADPAHSTASFAVKHMVANTVHGRFGKLTSTANLDPQDPTKGNVTATIEVASITTDNEKRDGHLKSADFFDAQKCPQITFKSNKLEKAGADQLKVTGDLTIHCVTRPVTLDATYSPNPIKSPFGTTVSPATATTRIKRSDFGLTWNKTLETGGVLVSDDVNIELNLEYVAKQAEGKKEAAAETQAPQT